MKLPTKRYALLCNWGNRYHHSKEDTMFILDMWDTIPRGRDSQKYKLLWTCPQLKKLLLIR